jgi:hemoglobin
VRLAGPRDGAGDLGAAVSGSTPAGIDSDRLPDLTGRCDIETLLRAFYSQAFADDLLGPVFLDVAQMDLDAHLPVICDFWETVLFRAGLYRRNALQVHADLHAASPLSAGHFARWLALWTATVDAHFAGEKAELAKIQATRIAYSISRRLLGASGSEFVTIQRPRRSTQ